MIVFYPFWNTIKRMNISTYELVEKYGFSSAFLTRIRENGNLNLNTINKICEILNCGVEDVIKYLSDDEYRRLIDELKLDRSPELKYLSNDEYKRLVNEQLKPNKNSES